jgi:hypothetical protein
MKLRFGFFLCTLLFGVFACAAKMDAASSSADELATRAPVIMAARESAMRAAAMLLDHPSPGRAAVGKIGGSIQVYDEQLRNRHGVTADFGPVGPEPLACGDVLALEDGAQCIFEEPCPGGAAGEAEAGAPPNLGVLSVSSTFDAMQIAASGGPGPSGAVSYSAERAGAFWRGDGDFVTIALSGRPDRTPLFERRLRAPTGDVYAPVPQTPIERSAPLRFRWMYAAGPEEAVGNLVFTLLQFTGSRVTTLVCTARLASRSIRLPTTILQRFTPGEAYLFLSSMVASPSDESGIRILLTSTVDPGAEVPDVVFR